jgi:UDP-N-acetyl-2-amino-2-deoxyglucuronate dehydrogenase
VISTSFHNIESEDTCVATLEFKNGVVGTLQATTAAYPGYARHLEITGTEGTVRLEQDRIVRVDLRIPIPDATLSKVADQNPSSNSPVISDVRGHQRIIEDFIHCIHTGGTPVCDGREGLRSLAVVESIYRAAGARDAALCRSSA